MKHIDTALISLYPKKGETYSAGITGVASYAKNTIQHIGKDVLVLADYSAGTPRSYKEQNTHVLRCFKRNSVGMWKDIYMNLRRFPKIKHIFVQFDTAMYGNMLVSGLIIPFLALLKLRGYHVHVINHHVIADVNKLKGHIGLSNSFVDRYKSMSYNTLFHTFYTLLGLVSTTVIVLEKSLETQLAQYMNKSKIKTIPHAVDIDMSVVTKRQARKNLGLSQDEHVVMFFGYINWFKGADIFVNTFANKQAIAGKKARFIVAGGISPTLKDKAYYQKYFGKVTKKVSKSRNIQITGYVPQEKIAEYFAAADLVVFPYREFICASGVLSLAFTFQRPFILSHQLGKMNISEDFKQALRSSDLTEKDICFALNKKAIVRKAQSVLRNGKKAKLQRLASIIRQERSFENNARAYALLTKTAPAQAPAQAPTRPSLRPAFRWIKG